PFFYFCLGRPEDFDLHRFAAKRSLELADARLGLAELGRRHDVLTSTYRGLAATLEQVLPARKQRPRDAQLTTQLPQRRLAALNTSTLFALELRCEQPSPVGSATNSGFHEILLVSPVYSPRSVSSNRGSDQRVDTRADSGRPSVQTAWDPKSAQP